MINDFTKGERVHISDITDSSYSISIKSSLPSDATASQVLSDIVNQKVMTRAARPHQPPSHACFLPSFRHQRFSSFWNSCQKSVCWPQRCRDLSSRGTFGPRESSAYVSQLRDSSLWRPGSVTEVLLLRKGKGKRRGSLSGRCRDRMGFRHMDSTRDMYASRLFFERITLQFHARDGRRS